MAGAADVGRDDDVGEAEEGVIERERLGDGHVEGGAADGAGVERLDERILIDHAATSGVHEDGRFLHRIELGRAEEALGFGAVGHVDADEVGACEQLGEGDALDAELALDLGAGGAGGGEHGHAEAGGSSGDGAADLAEADDTEGRAGGVGTEEGGRRPGSPATLARVAVAEDDVAGGGEKEGKGEVGGGFVENTGGVRNPDTGGGGRFGVDVVVADSHVRDDAESFGGSEEVGADGVGDHCEGPVSREEVFAQSLGGRGHLAGPDGNVVPSFTQKLYRATGHLTGDEDMAHSGRSYVALALRRACHAPEPLR